MLESNGHRMTKQQNFKILLGPKYDSNLEYQLVFPSSYQAKARDGWKLELEDAEQILGQSLIVISRERTN
jgi:hypothetical protein